MTRLSFLLTLALCAFTFMASAADDESKPSPEALKLHRTIGKWKVDETNHESPFGPAGKSTYDTEIRPIHGGHYVEERGKGVSMGKKVTFSTLTYWDGAAKVYRGLYYDSNGFVFPAEATMDGDTFSYRGSFEAEGKKYQMKGRTTIAPDNKTLQYEWTFSPDDGKTWKPMFSGTARRTGK